MLAAAVTAIVLGGCNTVSMYASVDDAHAFLMAVRNDDRATFDRFVEDGGPMDNIIRQQCYNAGHRDRAMRDCADSRRGERLSLTPEAFRTIAAELGYAPDRPAPLALALQMRSLSYDQVCVQKRRSKTCLLTFASGSPDGWKLISAEPDSLRFE